MKRIISILMSITVILSMMPALAFATDGDSTGSSTSSEATDVKTPADTNDSDTQTQAPSNDAGNTDTVASVGDENFASLKDAIGAADGNKTIVLKKSITESVTIPKGKTIILDLNKNSIECDGECIFNEGTLTLKNGNIVSKKSVGIGVGNNSVTTIEKETNVSGREGAVITGKSTGATITINDGEFSAADNAVVAGNGSERTGEPNTININGGVFTGKIESTGYIACGIYAPWKDNINVKGGTFNVTGGVGILARGGNISVSAGAFKTTGSVTGWVGDNKNAVSCADLVFDSNANYPALDDNSKITVTGGTFTSETSAVSTIKSESDNGKRLFVAGGTFSGIDALNYTTDDANISVSLNDNVEKDIVISKGSTVTLDLNGHTFTGTGAKGTAAITNNGSLVIEDNKNAGLITRKSTESNTHYVIDNQGSMEIHGGTIHIVNPKAMPKGASLIRNAGVKDAATLKVSGGNIGQDGFIAIKNDDYGILEITGGKITTSGDTDTNTASAVQNWNKATITGGTIEGTVWTSSWSSDYEAASTVISGDAKVTGMIISRKYKSDVTKTPVTEIKGGTYDIKSVGVDGKDNLKISGGTFASNPKEFTGEAKVYAKDSKFYVGTAPDHSTGMNAWDKDENGIYTETYVAPAPEPEKNPITNSGSSTAGDSTTKLDASDNTTTTDGKTETKIDTELGGKVVDNAVENKSTDVKIDAATAKGDSTESNVVLPATTVKDISDKTQASITVNTDNASVSLDKKAVDAVAEKAGTTGDVKLVVQTKEVKDNKVVVELKIETANGEVHDFKGGIATVTVPVHKDMKDKELVAVYIDENGKYTILDGKKNADGTFTFTTGHFSTYAVMTKEDADAAVEAQKIENAEVSGIVAKTYTGKEITQDVVVTLGDKTLTAGTDYDVTYENNVKVGLASVKIAGKGKYEGEITKTFKINPKSVALTSVKAQKKALKATWKKSANKVTGYQVRYSTSKTFKSSKTASVKYTKKVNSKVVKNLKSNKRYYVKVRTYTKTADRTYYSVWSKAKSAKVK